MSLLNRYKTSLNTIVIKINVVSDSLVTLTNFCTRKICKRRNKCRSRKRRGTKRKGTQTKRKSKPVARCSSEFWTFFRENSLFFVKLFSLYVYFMYLPKFSFISSYLFFFCIYLGMCVYSSLNFTYSCFLSFSNPLWRCLSNCWRFLDLLNFWSCPWYFQVKISSLFKLKI
jgi:hypothetical protein